MKLNLVFLIIAYFTIVVIRLIPNWTQEKNDFSHRVIGGIVPHHLLVRDIIGNFFSNLPKDNVDNVIIVGPNHLELGDSKIIYNPPFDDQSISAIEPFAKNTFPRSKIVTLVLKKTLTLSDCAQLANNLASIPGHNLLVASIDFSHYLSSNDAEKNDRQIASRIANKDYQGILNLSSDYLDSPPSLVTALLYFEKKGMIDMKLLANTNSGRRGNPYEPTTSYFSILVYGQDK